MGSKRRGKQVSAGKVSISLVLGVTFAVVLLLFGLFASGEVKPADATNVGQMGDPNTDAYAWMGMYMREANLKDPGPYPELSPGADPVFVRVQQVGWYFRKFHVSGRPFLYALYKETGQLPYKVPDSPMWSDQLFLDPGKNYPPIAGDGRGWIYKMLDANYPRQNPMLEEMHGRRCVAHLQRLDMIFQGKPDTVDWREIAFAQSRDDSLRHMASS